MLVDVPIREDDDLNKIFDLIFEPMENGQRVRKIQTGVYECVHFNFGNIIMAQKNEWPDLRPDCMVKQDHLEEWEQMGEYGVCDSPEQLLAAYDFEKDDRMLAVSLVEVRRDEQPSDGGWRYHKWGTYIGNQEPKHEYLYHDKHIESVWCYHIYEIKG